MKNKILFAGIIAILSINKIVAQAIDAEPEVSTVCGGGSANLTATVIPAGSPGAPGSLPTTNYAISTIPYAPDPLTAGTSVALTDDSQTGLIPLGFTFCYYGNSYTQFIIGSNNWIGFQTGETSTWVTTPIPNNTGTAPRNTIMGPWQDINPGVGGTVRYQMYGTAPFRRMSVSWNNVPMFSCTGQLYSSQIIIYETTNIIETHILNKSLCTTWNSGNAVHGLHNATGTAAVVVPGRNNTQWIANNEGTRFTPNGPATYTINWYILPANTLIGTGPSITVTPAVSPQYYYAEVVGPNGCNPLGSGVNNTDTVVVFSSNLSVTAGPPATICENSSTTLNAFAPGGINYTWVPATGLSNPTIPNPIASPTTTTTYTVNVTDALGCSGSAMVTVNVNPAPFVDAGFGAAICNGDNIQLGGNGAGTVAWSPAGSLDNPSILTPTASPTTTTTYTLTITDGIGCSASDTATVFISNANADAGPTAAICTGLSTTLAATGGTMYSWSASPSLSSLTISNPVANPTTTTTYTVSIFDAGTGCTTVDTVSVIVHPLPTASAGSNVAICTGNSTTLNATGGSTYTWTPATGLSNPNISNPVANPTATTTYTVNVTNGGGCSATANVTVTVNALPNVDAGAFTNICPGGSTTLNATGATNYVWSPGASLSNPNIANPVATPPSATTYTVTGTDANGCIASDTVSITLNGITVNTTASSSLLCAGTSTNLTATGAGVGGSYSWLPATGLSNPSIANPVATPSVTTTYTVTGTASTGCTSTSTITITVNPIPNIDAGTALAICTGQTANLSATGAGAAGSYLWSPSASLSNPNIANPISSATSSTLYTVVGTDANGCSSSDTVSVIVHAVPLAGAGSNTSICAGTSTTLNGTGGGTYSWSPATGLSSSTIANPVAAPSSTTTYTVTVSNSGCTNTAQVTVTVNPVPVATATGNASICAGVSTTISAGGGAFYSWSPTAGLTSPTSATTAAVPTSTTHYIVTVSNAFGCSDTASVWIVVSNAMSISGSTVTPANCGNNDGVVNVGTVTGGITPLTYSIDGGAGQASPVFSGLSSGTHTVTVTDANGCSTTQSYTVNTVNNVNAAFTANPPSGTSPLNVNFTNGSSGANNYVWTFGNGGSSFLTNPSTTYATNGQYTVTLFAYNNIPSCGDSVTFVINVYDEVVIIVPNIFSPNGDGVNDIFFAQTIGVKTISGTIFNRWGKKIYEWDGTPSSTLGWPGTINGNKAEDGQYYYIIKAEGFDGKEYNEKGYLQLVGGK
jgi:gliding motility-associated-like protein